MSAGNLMIVQGGGSTAVFNASLSSAIAEAICQQKVGRIFGARFGVKGLVLGDIVELGRMTAAELSLLRNSPGALLGSSRFKPGLDDLDRLVANLRRLDIRYLIFMGGNGTMHGAELVSRHCHAAGFEVQIAGVPKLLTTILLPPTAALGSRAGRAMWRSPPATWALIFALCRSR